MEPNFLPPKPIVDRSAQVRVLIGFFTIVIALGGGLGWQLIASSSDHVPSVVADEPQILVQREAPIGGDIVAPPPPEKEVEVPELIGEMVGADAFPAASVIVKDSESGAVLYRNYPYSQRPIASITKLMSALVVLEKDIDWESTATVVGADSLGTHMYAGDTYTMQELWDAALVGSSNKAIKSLANALGWGEVAFIERMNQKAMELGMLETRFTDTTGLDATDVSTASDVAILLEEALRHPKIVEALNMSQLNLYSAERNRSHKMHNTNWLMLGWIPHSFEALVGGKTGYTPAAGYSFAVQVADERNHPITVVVLGTQSNEARFTVARDVAEWVFTNYRWPGEEIIIAGTDE